MNFDIDETRAKSIARAIQRRCKSAGAKVAYGQALDGLAEGLGFRDWNTLSAEISAPADAPPTTPADPRSGLPIRGWVRTDEGVETTFDAAPFLAGLDRPTRAARIRDMARAGWRDDHAIDDAVYDAAARSDDATLSRIVEETEIVGFVAGLARDDVIAWLKANDLDLLTRLVAEKAIETDDHDVRRKAASHVSLRLMADRRPTMLQTMQGIAPEVRDVDPGAQLGLNTRIVYGYTRKDGARVADEQILMGPLLNDEISEITSLLPDGSFVPGQVGLQDLQNRVSPRLGWWNPSRDHVGHELLTLETTDARITTPLTAREFLASIRAKPFDPAHEPDGYAEMLARYQAHHGTPEAPRTPSIVYAETEPDAVRDALRALAGKDGYEPHPLLLRVYGAAEPFDARGYRTAVGDVLAIKTSWGGFETHGALEIRGGEEDWDQIRIKIEANAGASGSTPVSRAP